MITGAEIREWLSDLRCEVETRINEFLDDYGEMLGRLVILILACGLLVWWGETVRRSHMAIPAPVPV